jgi:hypothetical protein
MTLNFDRSSIPFPTSFMAHIVVDQQNGNLVLRYNFKLSLLASAGFLRSFSSTVRLCFVF